MDENGKEKTVTLEDIRKGVDKNANDKIDPNELWAALKKIAKLEKELATKEEKKALRKQAIKESFGQGGLMTIAVVLGSGVFAGLMILIEALM